MSVKERMTIAVALGVATGRLTYDGLTQNQRALFDGWGWGLKTDADPRERAEMIVLAAILGAYEVEDRKP